MATRSYKSNGTRKANRGGGSVTGNKTTRSGAGRTAKQRTGDRKRRKSWF